MRLTVLCLRLALAAPLAWSAIPGHTQTPPVAAAEQPALFDATTGYRIARYRTPVAAAPAAVRTVNAKQARRLLQDKRALAIDVLPTEGTSYDPRTGVWILTFTHANLPGSLWYPNVGYGHVDPVLAAWFQTDLKRLTRGDQRRPVLLYCRVDCWMSWNAAKRLVEWGYRNVYWFPEGVEGWDDAGYKLTPATPIPVTIISEENASTD
jgi:PQQ-dependent catabolism-associated CXXCW motif protein